MFRSAVLGLVCISLLGFGSTQRPRAPARGAAAKVEPDEVDEVDEDGVVAAKPFESIFPMCRKMGKEGILTEKKYDSCIAFCCGGEVVEKKEGLKCCGSEELGSPYIEGEFTCCSWWTGYGKAYRTEIVTNHRYGCCGEHLINHGHQRCCYGDGPPEPFNWRSRTETCCGSKMVRLASVYSSPTCCGNSAAYDKRRQSCPCEDGQVANAGISETACCLGSGDRKAPYMLKTQFCCDGAVGTNGKDFCCGSEVGTIGNDVCCDDVVVPVTPPNPAKTKCCALRPYDPAKQMCCNGEIKPVVGRNSECCGLVPFNPTTSICCEGEVWDKKKDGGSCCGPYAFFPEKKSFCCKGVVYFTAAVKGDACCGDKFYDSTDGNSMCCNEILVKSGKKDSCCDETPYDSRTEICCMGNVFDKIDGDTCCHNVPYFPSDTTICCELGPSGHFHRPECCGGNGYDAAIGGVCCAGNIFEGFIWPSCCVNVGYDAATHTCCGSTIYPNPRGSFLTGCCGDVAPVPYDKLSQMCCDGVNVNVPAGIPRSLAECCGHTGIYNPGTHMCCDGKVHVKENIYFTKCCGRQTYNSLNEICCDGKDGSKPTIDKIDKFADRTSCCGNVVYDSKTQYCCEGVLTKSKPGVSACCNGEAFDRTKNICCGGRLKKISANVPWKKAICCGSDCMYDGPQFCCEDRIYIGTKRSTKTCTNY